MIDVCFKNLSITLERIYRSIGGYQMLYNIIVCQSHSLGTRFGSKKICLSLSLSLKFSSKFFRDCCCMLTSQAALIELQFSKH